MGLNDKPFMKDVKFITLNKNRNCRGCSVRLKQGQEVIRYKDMEIGGIYCGTDCLDSYRSNYIRSGRFGRDAIESFLSRNDTKKIKKRLRL